MADNGNAQGLGGVNKAVPIGAGPKSGNDFMGIDNRIGQGTTGSRPESSSRYGGDSNDGTYFVGPSVAGDSRELNSGGGARPSADSGQYGAGSPGWASGGYGSRENMPKYGSEANKGKLVGDGAGATKNSSGPDQLKRDLPTQMDTMKGTSDGEKNMAKAERGIGKAGKAGARM